LAAILKSIKIIENITGMDFYFAKDAGSDLSKLMQMKDTSYQAPFVNYHIESKPLENYLNFVKSENQLSFLIEEYKPSFQELMQHSNKVSVKVKKMILDKLTNK
jgi:predicted outer membrane protein